MEHPTYTRDDWKHEVSRDETILGYAEWVEQQIEANDDE
jgi:hypothetical protein